MSGLVHKGVPIESVCRSSPANLAGIRDGDILKRINGNVIRDVLDFKYFAYDADLLIEVERNGKKHFFRVHNAEGNDLGLEFGSYLMDKERSCSNRCIFCFIDQLPKGMRRTLYYKDDDARLSFLQGNYITLTNLSGEEIDRIIKLRISPLNISVHTMNPQLRSFMLGNPKGGGGVAAIIKLANAGITLHCQIVVCPGINDGDELIFTMRELEKLHPSVASVSVVPVGITKFRDNLYPLVPFDHDTALQTVKTVTDFAETCRNKHGIGLFYIADELYIKAGLDFPDDDSYDDYPQLENGVGLARLLITEFRDAVEHAAEETSPISDSPFTIVTGQSAAPIINNLLFELRSRAKYAKIKGNVIAVKNEFFGETVNVAGLVVGRDIIRTLSENPPAGRILIPRSMLRHGETVFLDDTPLSDIADRFGVEIRVVERGGADLFNAMIGF